MATAAQTYPNHARYYPLWHFFAFPALGANAGLAVARLIRQPSWDTGWAAVVAVALVAAVFASRTMALTVQNRLIRLEERLRLEKVLPPDLQEAGAAIRTSLLLGLRFAPDDEVPGLVRRISSGELTTRKEVKQAISGWKADWMRV